jgi:hypothetical protein
MSGTQYRALKAQFGSAYKALAAAYQSEDPKAIRSAGTRLRWSHRNLAIYGLTPSSTWIADLDKEILTGS